MSSKAIAVVVVAALVIVMSAVIIVVKDDNQTRTVSLYDIDDYAQYFVIGNIDGEEVDDLTNGAEAFKNTYISSLGIYDFQWGDTVEIDLEHQFIETEITVGTETMDFIVLYKGAKEVDASVEYNTLSVDFLGVGSVLKILIMVMEIPEEEIEGDWDVVSVTRGSYFDGEIFYADADLLIPTATFTEIDDGFYELELGDDKVICAKNKDIALSSSLESYGYTAFISGVGDNLTVSYLSEDGATVIKLERDTDSTMPLIPDDDDFIPPSLDNVPAVGTVWDAVRFTQYTNEGPIDHLDENQYMTMDRVEDDMIFYTVDSDITTLYFVAIRISPADYVALADFGDGAILVDMVYFKEGLMYTSSFDNIESEEPELWSAVYGDASKMVIPELDLTGMQYYGREVAYIFDDNEIIGTTDVEITLTVDDQFDDMIVISTVSDDLEELAEWGGQMYDAGPFYRILVESRIVYNDVDYYGYYICTLSKNLKELTVIGALDSGYGGIVFKQVYDLLE